jgi:hypothetical protein
MTTWRIALPALFVHVIVKVVTDVIVTDVCWPFITAPTPLSIVQLGSGNVGSTANVQFHVTIVGVPEGTWEGDAWNDVSDGANSGASIVLPLPAS